MTNEQHALLVKTIASVFGECSTNVDEDSMSIRVDAKGASVLVCFTGIEVESVRGPMMVDGWEIGLLDSDGEFVEEESTELFWHMVSSVAELLAEQAVYAARMNVEVERVMEEQQYE